MKPTNFKALLFAGIALMSFAACNDDDDNSNEFAVYDVNFCIEHDKLFDAFIDDASLGGNNFANILRDDVLVSNFIYDSKGILCEKVDTIIRYGTAFSFSDSLQYGNYSVISMVRFMHTDWEHADLENWIIPQSPNWVVSGEESLQTFAVEEDGILRQADATLGLTYTKLRVDNNKEVNISVTPITSLLTMKINVTWQGDEKKQYKNVDTLELIHKPGYLEQVKWDGDLTFKHLEEGKYRRYCIIDPSYYGNRSNAVVEHTAVPPRSDFSIYPYVHYMDTDSWQEFPDMASEPINLEPNKQYLLTYRLLDSKVVIEEMPKTKAFSTWDENETCIQHWDIEDGKVSLKRNLVPHQ